MIGFVGETVIAGSHERRRNATPRRRQFASCNVRDGDSIMTESWTGGFTLAVLVYGGG
jgi:hypothetical protein